MHCTDLAKLPTNQVMALFADSVILFSLSKGATFADLADRLDHLAERHTGMPTAIYLKVAWPGARFLPVNPDPVPSEHSSGGSNRRSGIASRS